MHGSNDTLVSPEQSANLYNALKKAGDRAEYVLIEGAEHGDYRWYQPGVITKVTHWFRQALGGPVKSQNPSAADPDAR